MGLACLGAKRPRARSRLSSRREMAQRERGATKAFASRLTLRLSLSIGPRRGGRRSTRKSICGIAVSGLEPGGILIADDSMRWRSTRRCHIVTLPAESLAVLPACAGAFRSTRRAATHRGFSSGIRGWLHDGNRACPACRLVTLPSLQPCSPCSCGDWSIARWLFGRLRGAASFAVTARSSTPTSRRRYVGGWEGRSRRRSRRRLEHPPQARRAPPHAPEFAAIVGAAMKHARNGITRT
jgi:hypothetical protein